MALRCMISAQKLKSSMKTVIMAGGRGTRIASLNDSIPKPLFEICGKPVLEHEILSLKEQGLKDFIITVGYMHEKIIDYFGDGKRWNVNIEYFIEDKPLGNAGAIFKIKNKLKSDFLLINADSLFDIDINRLLTFHNQKNGLATIFTHPNSHPFDSGLVITDENNSVLKWLSKEDERPTWYKNRVNAGIHILSPKLFHKTIDKEKIDLDRDILKPLCNSGKLFAYDSPEYVRDMGTPERFQNVCDDFSKGIVQKHNLLKKQKAIFLDRDGTINKYKGFIRNIDDFELIDGVSDAIRLINASEYLSIVITNQPVIARGEVSLKELNEIHNKMETLLGNDGAYIDKIYFCPHHPDKGFEGERIEYKIDCDCRKPKPGLLIKASQEYNIVLSQSWMIGDSDIDIIAGKRAGCKTIYIGSKPLDIECDYKTDSLLNAVKIIMESK